MCSSVDSWSLGTNSPQSPVLYAKGKPRVVKCAKDHSSLIDKYKRGSSPMHASPLAVVITSVSLVDTTGDLPRDVGCEWG